MGGPEKTEVLDGNYERQYKSSIVIVSTGRIAYMESNRHAKKGAAPFHSTKTKM